MMVVAEYNSTLSTERFAWSEAAGEALDAGKLGSLVASLGLNKQAANIWGQLHEVSEGQARRKVGLLSAWGDSRDELLVSAVDTRSFLAGVDTLEWAAVFDEEECQEMRKEFQEAVLRASSSGDWEAYLDVWADWRATAEVLSNPELAARLMASGDPDEEVLLARP